MDSLVEAGEPRFGFVERIKTKNDSYDTTSTVSKFPVRVLSVVLLILIIYINTAVRPILDVLGRVGITMNIILSYYYYELFYYTIIIPLLCACSVCIMNVSGPRNPVKAQTAVKSPNENDGLPS